MLLFRSVNKTSGCWSSLDAAQKKEIKMTESIFSSVWNFSLVSQMSFYGDFGGVAKSWLFSQAWSKWVNILIVYSKPYTDYTLTYFFLTGSRIKENK